MIRVSQLRRLLIAGHLAAGGGAVAALGAAWWMPLPSVPDPQDLVLPASAAPAPPTAPQQWQLSDWEPYWETALRRPLVDPAAAPPVTAPPPPKAIVRPKLNVRLIGTILEPGTSIALLQVGTGDVQLRKPGEAVEGVADCQVLEVAAQVVRLRHIDREVTLELLPDRP